MVVNLPEQFLNWNYYARGKMIEGLLQGRSETDMNQFFLESTRHNPALCTAYRKSDGQLYVNAKIVGIGYVLREDFLAEATEALLLHAGWGDSLFEKASTGDEKRQASSEYQRQGMSLLSKYLYLEPNEASRRLDFTKMSTLELALDKPQSAKHTWTIMQQNKTACLLFYRPPSITFELHGTIDIHEKGLYHKFVNAVHNTFHYASKEARNTRWPVYIFNVEEVYDNSPGRETFGKKIA